MFVSLGTMPSRLGAESSASFIVLVSILRAAAAFRLLGDRSSDGCPLRFSFSRIRDVRSKCAFRYSNPRFE